MPTSERPSEADDWFSLAIPLIEELDDPQRMATTTPTQVIANAARLRGLTPRAVGKQILAAKFLRVTYPERVASGPILGGYSQVEYLAKIRQLDPARADRLVGPVLSAEVSMAQMRAAYNEVVTSTGGPTSSAAKAKQRGVAFESACEAAIRANGAFFHLAEGSALVADYRLLDTVLDFAVLRDGRPISAIEVRIGGLASAKREASTLTARLALLAGRVEHVYVLVPAASEDLAEAVQESLRAWGVERANVATVDERPPNTLKYSVPRA
jgi:hypothetical protein